jgi:hypothetical protein
MTATAIANLVGITGAALIIFAYLLLQLGRLDSRSLAYSVSNGLGASGIIYSLVFEFNLSALVIESFWLAISLYGVIRAFRSIKSASRLVADSGDVEETAAQASQKGIADRKPQ